MVMVNVWKYRGVDQILVCDDACINLFFIVSAENLHNFAILVYMYLNRIFCVVCKFYPSCLPEEAEVGGPVAILN